MNAFFWSRRKSSKEVVRTVDALLAQLCPDQKLYQALDEKPKRERIESLDAGEPDFEAPPPTQEDESSDDQSGDESEKTVPEELERHWALIRAVFHGWDEHQLDRQKKMDRMAELLVRYRVMEKVLVPSVLAALTFETRKYVGHVFRALTVHNLQHFIELLAEHPEMMRRLVEGYRNNDTALICGAMLRDCFEYECLALLFLQDMTTEFEYLFEVTTTNANFDISADAFMNITRLLMSHKQATFPCLNASFDRIFGLINSLLRSPNYVIKRQALQLLAELLLDPINFPVMQRYIASRQNLKLVMLLLREPSQALRMDAFHVFKIFVANPNKSVEVEQLLMLNREKLLSFVSDFGRSESNRDFHQEKSLLIFTLQRMADKEQPLRLARATSAPGSAASSPTPKLTKTISMSSQVPEVCANNK
ncbi:TPA: hypothetical protein N0F65_006432 [Lagenidium giganteum]|uniref:Calcium-binding protein 39 n=1 Tax=Lagenidium giganteum TaxID=4803 RepID=A0AAV2Z593_9STRA|nr:TPA: hypothetical protein N0F65_006432 [Lagenidium giganteum]